MTNEQKEQIKTCVLAVKEVMEAMLANLERLGELRDEFDGLAEELKGMSEEDRVAAMEGLLGKDFSDNMEALAEKLEAAWNDEHN
jgi:hypothetical protein